MSKPTQPIGVFDSGLGGLSLLTELKTTLVHESVIYIADSRYAPYGNKSAEVLIQRCFAITDYLIKQNVKAIVVACNTATVNVIQLLREHYPHMPFIGIEPAIKPAILSVQSKVVGVWATANTIKSQRLNELLQQHHCPHTKVILQACDGLAESLEQGKVDEDLIVDYLSPLLKAQIDTLVLACTHYPFAKRNIETCWQQLTQQPLIILDPATAVIKQLIKVLADKKMLTTKEQVADIQYFTSGEVEKVNRVANQLIVNEAISFTTLEAENASNIN